MRATAPGSLEGQADSDEIADLVLQRYARLPSKLRPILRSNGCREWTIVAGVVLTTPDRHAECVALATGMKAVSERIVSASSGKVVHDMHAEILTLRAFARFLIDECSTKSENSRYVRPHAFIANKFQLVPGVKIHLYVSTAPCGDASMGFFEGDSWDKRLDPSAVRQSQQMLRGREHFNVVGVIRTKPGRADSNMTMSKSCGDKLALMQTNGCVPGVLSHVFPDGIFLSTIVCPDFIEEDFERCFSRWRPRHRFSWARTSCQFIDSSEQIKAQVKQGVFASTAPSGASAVWTPGHSEMLVNGVRVGSKPLSEKGASVVCRSELARACVNLCPELTSKSLSYCDVKMRIKLRPAGWKRTAKDDFLIKCQSDSDPLPASSPLSLPPLADSSPCPSNESAA